MINARLAKQIAGDAYEKIDLSIYLRFINNLVTELANKGFTSVTYNTEKLSDVEFNKLFEELSSLCFRLKLLSYEPREIMISWS